MRASIVHAFAADNYILYIALTNGNEMVLDFKQLFEYQLFIALADIIKWRTMRVNRNSIYWGEGSKKVEISIDELLNYFA